MRRRVLVLLVLLVSAAAPVRAWQTSLADTPPDGRPFGLAVDSLGNLLTGGRTPGASGFSDGIAARLNALDGTIAWQRLVIGSRTGNDIVRAVAVDANGNLLVFGQVANTGTNADALVAKLGSLDGTPLWRRDIDGGTLGSDDARAGALLPGGDIIAAGSSPQAGNPDPIAVWRLSAGLGTTTWTQRLPGAGGAAQRVAIAGESIFVGAHVPNGDGTRFSISRLAASNGAIGWTETVINTGANGDELTGLVVSGTRVVFSARLRGGLNAPNFVVGALDTASGDEVWRVILDGSAIGVEDADGAHALAVDPGGAVLATGILSNLLSADDILVLKLRATDGVELWRATAVGSDPNSEDGRDVAVDGAGDVLVGGRLRNLGANGDMSVVKLAGATGTVVWQSSFDGTQHGADTAFNVAVGLDGNVAVAGRLRNGDAGDGYAVARLSGASGGSFPCGNGSPNAGEACDDGNAVAGDGCRNDCTIEACGDGRLDPQDQCDDGNTLDGDCCSSTCILQDDGTECDDGDACTTPDRCAEGLCIGEAPLACPEGGACQLGFCDPEEGGCVLELLPNGTRCDDGNQCTINDRCGDGVCVGGPPPFCDDDDPCTTDACEAAAGCVHPSVSGYASVLCVFERREIPFECRNPLPEPLSKRLEKTELMLNVTATEPRPKVACRGLKRAGKSARKAQRFATRFRDNGLLPFHCGQAIVDQMIFLRARIAELRTGGC